MLVQGWLINSRNCDNFVKVISLEMIRLENALAKTNRLIPITKVGIYIVYSHATDFKYFEKIIFYV